MTSSVWERLTLDITHMSGWPHLSCIDCASRFMIWRGLKDESAKEVCTHLRRLVVEMEPLEEVVTDNGTVFRKVLKCRGYWKYGKLDQISFAPTGHRATV